MELTGLSAVLGVIALVSSGIASLLLGSLKTLRESNADLRDRVGDLEKENNRNIAEIVLLKNDRDALARVVRGDDRLEEMVSKQDEHHVAALEHWKTEESLLRMVVQQIGGVS
jgi:hypothetical protein